MVFVLTKGSEMDVELMVGNLTYSLKTDEGREINHHGNPRTVGEKENNNGHSIKVA